MDAISEYYLHPYEFPGATLLTAGAALGALGLLYRVRRTGTA